MSSHEISFSGTVNLKPGTTWQQIKVLYQQNVPDKDDDSGNLQLALDVEPTPTLDEWMSMLSNEDYGYVHFQFGGDQLSYSVGGEHSYTFVDEFEDFLTALAAVYAASGWISFEGEEDHETTYGPTEIDSLKALIAHREQGVVAAQASLTSAIKQLQELEK